MKILVLVMLIIGLTSLTALGEQKYNAMENRWETVPNNSNWQTQYNAMENDWSYQPDNAQTEYNAMENKWEWNSGHNPDSYDNDRD